MKKIVLLSSLTLLITIMSGCSGSSISDVTTIAPNADIIVYTNTKFNFTLKLPKSWEGKYDVVDDVVQSSTIEKIGFINKANKAGAGGLLFTISIWTNEQWSTDGVELAKNIQISKIGQKGDKTFTFSTPSDVQFNPNDLKLQADYLSMANETNTIKASFEIKN